jgi:predicted ATPase/class 3 adenylate cyclase
VRSDLPTGTVTFLFTDVEGSTRLLHHLGPDSYAHALAEHRHALRAAFAAHDGAEVDTQGDAFFVAFPTASGAASAALAGHRALEDGPIRVRVGLHTGTPTVTGEGYVGIDVHRAARIAALAHGGQTLLSEATAGLLVESELVDLGSHRLKDFDGPVRLLQLGGDAFPPLRTPGSVELPTPATRFLGREQELFDAVSVALEGDPRVLTIVGPGGTGKTRFAIELARLLADEAEGGTVFVPLAAVRDPALLLAVVAERLGEPSPEVREIASRVGQRRTHVVLDNLEQLLPDAASTVASIAASAPALRLIVTSREALRIGAETQFDLPPLRSDEAVELFLTRARAVRPDVERTHAVEELCHRLDLLPLPIELAAARTGLLAPNDLLERLGARLDLLRGGRDADPRHATLRATIAWSYDLLDPEEQAIFARLSVFAAGCTLEAAETLCRADVGDLESLLDKSLIRRRVGIQGEERLWMLETIKEFAVERLEENGEAESLRRRHASHMLALARAAQLEDDGSSQPQRHEIVRAELADLRSALDWAAEHDPVLGLELTVALENHWAAANPTEGARRTEALLERATTAPPELRASGLRVLGGTLYRSGEFERGRALCRESMEAFNEVGDERAAANLLARIAVDASWFDDTSRAVPMAEKVIELGVALDLPRMQAEGLGALAHAIRRNGDLEAAVGLARRSVDVARECGFAWWEGNTLVEVMELELELGRLDEAESAGRAALRVSTSTDDRLAVLWAIAGLAMIEHQRGDLARAGRLIGAVDADLDRDRQPLAAGIEEFTAPLAALTDARLDSARAEGRGLALDDAIALALGDAQTVP